MTRVREGWNWLTRHAELALAWLTHRAALVLLALALLTLGLGLVLYPGRAAVYRPLPPKVGVTVASAKSLQDIDVRVTRKSGDVVAMSFTFNFCSLPFSAACPVSAPRVSLNISAPGEAVPSSCVSIHSQRCSYASELFDNALPGAFTTIVTRAQSDILSAADAAPGNPVWTATANIAVRSRGYPLFWSSNGVTVEATFPKLDVVTPQGAVANGTTPVRVDYVGVPGVSQYDWTGGPTPVIVNPIEATWSEPLSTLTTATAISGTDNTAVNSDDHLILVAGILFGIAGGALVGAIQELLHRG